MVYRADLGCSVSLRGIVSLVIREILVPKKIEKIEIFVFFQRFQIFRKPLIG